MAKEKKHRLRKAIISIVLIIVVLVLIVVIVFFSVWHNEFSTYQSFKMLRERNDDHEDGAVYSMRVSGDYYFEQFLYDGGASSDTELISYITQNITKGLVSMGLSESNIGCSSFTCSTTDGDRLFARNYDFSKTNTCIVFTDADESKSRHATISTVDLQFIGMDVDQDVTGIMNKITCLAAPYVPLDGMNDAGVSCGIYMSYQGDDTGDNSVVSTDQDTEYPDITSTTMLRMILDYADDVDEAVELINMFDLHDSANTSYHYMVADATGKSAILEWVPGEGVTKMEDTDGSERELNVLYNTDSYSVTDGDTVMPSQSNFQCITNFIISDGYYEYEGGSEDRPGLDRYETVYNKLAETSGVVADVDAAMDILRTVGRRTFSAIDNGTGITVHSVVYDLTNLSVKWVTNENYDDSTAVFTYSFNGTKFV